MIDDERDRVIEWLWDPAACEYFVWCDELRLKTPRAHATDVGRVFAAVMHDGSRGESVCGIRIATSGYDRELFRMDLVDTSQEEARALALRAARELFEKPEAAHGHR